MRTALSVLVALVVMTATPAGALEPNDFSEQPDAWHLQWLQVWEAQGALSPELVELRADLHQIEPSRDIFAPLSDDPVERWRPLVRRYFLPEHVDWALAIIRCESTGNPDAKSRRSTARGLFQHLETYWAERSTKAGVAGASIYDPEANVIVAAWLFYEGGGPRHWTCKA